MGGEKMSRGGTAILVVLSVLVFITLGLQFIVSLFTLSSGHLFFMDVFMLTSLLLAFEVGLLTLLVASINSSVQDMQKERQKELELKKAPKAQFG